MSQWEQFRKHRRHEVAELAHVTGPQILQYDFERTRKAMIRSPEFRAVALLSSASPACLQDGRIEGVSHQCVWHCNAVGNWHHMVWQCRHRPNEAPVFRPPLNAIQRRLGWIRKGEAVSRSTSLIAWLTLVQRRIWDLRYPSNRARRQGSERG